MAAPQAEDVRRVAEPAVARAGLVIDGITVTAAGRRRLLRIDVDLPEDAEGGVPMDAVSAAAREVSEVLDESDVMGAQPYVLEVSSPGVDRPLTERRHWLRARRRLVAVRLADGTKREGRLAGVDDDGITLDDRVLPWAEVSTGRVQVEFADPGGLDQVED
jgi:ribosome maturation factor RimP